jgi:5-methylcytosine-specific restriction endonuclease McrA
MDVSLTLPSYVGTDKISVKNYKNIYKRIVYQSEPIKSILNKLSIDIDKLSKDSDLYFSYQLTTNSSNGKEYEILSYIVYVIKRVIENDKDKIIDVIKTFDRNDINAGIRILEENSRKYSILCLIDAAFNYKPKAMSFNDVIQAIYQCPKGYIFNFDLMLNMKKEFFMNRPNQSETRMSQIIPFVSSNNVIFEYFHIELFGITHDEILKRLTASKWDQFLCIDNGKLIQFSKKSLYNHSNVEVMIVSKRQSDNIFKYSVKYIQDYLPKIQEVLKEEPTSIGKEPSLKTTTRKNIPKPLKNKLWKQYFDNCIKGNCYCCKEEIDALGNWEAGHILAAALGGPDTIENLRPICSTCNKSMGTTHMDEFKTKYFS